MVFPSPELQPLQSSAAELAAGDWATLREHLNRQGYLYLPQALDRDAVLAAREQVLEHLRSLGTVLDPAAPPSSGTLLSRCGMGCVPFMEGKNPITESAAVAGVIAGERLQRVLEGVLGEPAITFRYKWLRAMPREGFTGCHLDNVYMSRGSSRLHTVWIPLDDATTDLGALAMCEGSHRLPGFAHLQRTYGALDMERDGLTGTGWLTTNPREVAALDPASCWRTTDFAAGDVVLFGMHTLHASTANLTDRVRISCDVRWQPAADPVDERYQRPEEKRQAAGAWAKDEAAAEAPAVKGGAPTGSVDPPLAAPSRPTTTMPELRKRWGI